MKCKKCGKEMVFYICKTAKYWKCQPCRAAYDRRRPKAGRAAAAVRARDRAKRLCGVRSPNALSSQKTEASAHQRFQLWTTEDEALVSSGKFTQGELAKLLGRTLRGIQRKKARLRQRTPELLPTDTK